MLVERNALAAYGEMIVADVEDNLVVEFQGELIECNSLADAIAVKMAGDALDEGVACHVSTAEFDRLANVLIRYGRLVDAERLIHLGSRMRAMEFLVGNTGNQRPKQSS
jgi:hypothetical protein